MIRYEYSGKRVLQRTLVCKLVYGNASLRLTRKMPDGVEDATAAEKGSPDRVMLWFSD